MSDSRPYRSGPPLRTGDRVGVEIGDEIIVGTAHVEGDAREQRITLIPDGEPMLYGRDYAFAEVLAEDDLKITAKRWLPREPIPPIPYDEMRRLCGLDPAVKGYCARRDMQKSFSQIGKALNQVASDIGKGLERFADALIASKPKHTPPMWAHNPARQHRDTRSTRRVK